jgi:acetyl esterase/lipase
MSTKAAYLEKRRRHRQKNRKTRTAFSLEKRCPGRENKDIMTRTQPETILNIIREENARKVKTVEEARQNLKTFYKRFRSGPDIAAETFHIGHIPTFRICMPGVSENYTVLFFHGGGFMVGSAEDHFDLCAKLSRSADCCVFSIDYRLAPEHVFPAALDDCVASYLKLLETGSNPALIVPVGVSAGGNLLLSMFLKLRVMDIPLPKIAVCISPAVDLTPREGIFEKNADKDWLLKDGIELTRKVYLRDHDPKDPFVSPTYGDLQGFPSLFIQAGTHEILFDDISTFVGKARKAGIDVTFDIWEGMFHCWQIFSSVLPEGQQAIENIGAYIKKTLQAG